MCLVFLHWRHQQKHIHTCSYAPIHSTLTCPRVNTIHLFALTIVHALLLTLASTSSGMPLILKHTLTHHTHLHLPTHVLIFATLNLPNTLPHTFIHSLTLTCSPNTGTAHCSVYTKLSPPHRRARYRAGLNSYILHW